MKNRDVLLIFFILAFAGAIWLLWTLLYAQPAGWLQISVDNKVFGVYKLSENREIAIGDTNICQIKDGEVSMIYGDCPDKVCVHSLDISQNGQTIICMPNRVVLEIIEDEAGSLDTIVE